jgi:hypothetical protein
MRPVRLFEFEVPKRVCRNMLGTANSLHWRAPFQEASAASTLNRDMSPRSTKPDSSELLAHEFAQERAAALGRLGRALEASLVALATFDAESTGAECACHPSRRLRAALIERASAALWYFIVQREACGLRDMRHVLREYRVPDEVAVRMGAQPPSRGPTRRAD